jgi:transposase
MARDSSSTDWKEHRRLRAWALKRKGWEQTDIATALGVTPGAVSQWVGAAAKHGKVALRARPHTGRPPELTSAQLRLIPDLLSHGAEAYGFRGDVWTCPRIRQVIEWEFNVAYHKSHVARLLQELNWTPQMPIERATQRDESEITLWRAEVWPELKEMARLERRTLVFIDESGFYLLPAIVRSYAPRGHPPILHVFKTRDHLSVMSGITPRGELFTLTRYESLAGADSVHFLKHLRWQIDRKLLVIWDGSPIHRGEEVKAYLADGAARHIHLERLPGYAPDLNPDEGTWRHLKRVELRNVCCLDLHHLHHQLGLAILRLRRRTDLIQSFFAEADLAI